MYSVSKFDAQHKDLIHDIQYDFYGKRIATCSSDHRLKVWDADDSGKWVSNDSWRAHDAAVLRLSFSHPEFNSLLASSSFDRTAKIWEENEAEPRGSARRWTCRATFSESRGIVQGVAFLPNWCGLKVATVSSDGKVRLYEAADPVNPTQWTHTGEFQATYTSPSTAPHRDSDPPLCISFSSSRFRSLMVAVGCGRDNLVRVFRNEGDKWTAADTLPGHADAVVDVAWAPNVGRSYDLVATACKDARVRIFKISHDRDGHSAPPSPTDDRLRSNAMSVVARAPHLKVSTVLDSSDHGFEVWRCAWNAVGTVLATSGDDGRVRVWKCSYLDEWKCVSIVGAETPQPALGSGDDAYVAER